MFGFGNLGDLQQRLMQPGPPVNAPDYSNGALARARLAMTPAAPMAPPGQPPQGPGSAPAPGASPSLAASAAAAPTAAPDAAAGAGAASSQGMGLEDIFSSLFGG